MLCPNDECPDVVLSGEPGEYGETVEICPKCGARLVHELPKRNRGVAGPSPDLASGNDAFVPLRQFPNANDAALAASFLVAGGIRAMALHKSLLVRAAEAEVAEQALQQAEQAP